MPSLFIYHEIIHLPSHASAVPKQAEFIASLKQGGFDLILADYTISA